MKKAVLKIDIDTEGAMRGCVPRMLAELERRSLRATFCVPTAEDRSGLALARIVRQRGFIGKMIRNRAWRVFHPRTFLAGTFLPGRSQLAHLDLLRSLIESGHEIGLHGHSHQVWQDSFEKLNLDEMEDQLCLGLDAFTDALGYETPFFAAPAWKFNATSLKALCLHGIKLSSSCRGYDAGWLNCGEQRVLEIPTLPATLDEILPYGRFKSRREVEKMADHALKARLPVFGLHAEFEGGLYFDFLRELLDYLTANGYGIITLSEAAQLLQLENLPELSLSWRNLPGRTFPVAWVEKAGE